MITPYGVNYHAKACLEFLALQDLVPKLVRHYPDLLNGDPFIRTARFLRDNGRQYPKIEAEFSSLAGKLFFFDAIRPSYSPEKVKPGWNNNTKPFRLLNTDLTKVTINGFMETIQVPGNSRWFLSCRSILECRAMCHSLMWIIYQFGHQESAKHELCRFLTGFYANTSPDYLFLIDTMSRLFNFNSFIHMVFESELETLHDVLRGMTALCWFAIQAPPLIDRKSLLNSVPTVRLLFAMQQFEMAFNARLNFPSAVEMLDTFDRSTQAGHLGLKPINSILESSLQSASDILDATKCSIKDSFIVDHFSGILLSVSRQIQRRQGQGYASLKGLPEDGCPLFGIDDNEDADDLLMDSMPNATIVNWLRIRENFLFRIHRPNEIREHLENLFVHS